MRLSDYLLWLVKSYNPNKYEELLENKATEFVKFLLVTLGFAMLIFTILIIPVTLNYLGSIPSMTGQMQTLQLDATVEADHAIEILPRPSIVLDMQSNESTGDITLTREGVIYPKYLFFGTDMVGWSDIKDLKQETPVRDHFLKGLVIFIIPSIIFWFFLYSMLKIFIISLLLFVLGLLAPRLFGFKASSAVCLKVLVLSLPSLLFVDFGLYPIAPLFWWGVLLTSVLFFIGVALVSERRSAEEHHKRKV